MTYFPYRHLDAKPKHIVPIFQLFSAALFAPCLYALTPELLLPDREIVSEFTAVLRDESGLTRTKATELLDLFLDEISSGLVSVDRMKIKCGKGLKDGGWLRTTANKEEGVNEAVEKEFPGGWSVG